MVAFLNCVCLEDYGCKFSKHSNHFMPRYSNFSICATYATSGISGSQQEDYIWIVGNNFKHICVVIYMKTLLFRSYNANISDVANILVQCATCGTN